MSATETTANTVPIDDAIGQLENVYRAVTGKDAPAADVPYAPIPAEKDPTRHVEEQMNRLLELMSSQVPESPVTASSWSPPISVWEGDNEILLCMELAGVRRDGVEVRVQGNLLSVSGTRAPSWSGDSRLRMTERPLGPFHRTVVLPPGSPIGETRAQMRDGMLEIRIRMEAPWNSAAKSVPVN